MKSKLLIMHLVFPDNCIFRSTTYLLSLGLRWALEIQDGIILTFLLVAISYWSSRAWNFSFVSLLWYGICLIIKQIKVWKKLWNCNILKLIVWSTEFLVIMLWCPFDPYSLRSVFMLCISMKYYNFGNLKTDTPFLSF